MNAFTCQRDLVYVCVCLCVVVEKYQLTMKRIKESATIHIKKKSIPSLPSPSLVLFPNSISTQFDLGLEPVDPLLIHSFHQVK